jgi:hypothetical protein
VKHARAKTILVTVVLMVVGGIALVVQRAGPPLSGTLGLASGGYDICFQSPKVSDWAEQAAHGLSYGVDVLELSSDLAQVTVTAVEPIDPTGGIKLDKVAFVPNAEVDIGAPGNKPIHTTTRSLASMARFLPATLTVTAPPADEKGPYHPKAWQLTVTVHAPVNSRRARVNGFLITYKSGSETRHLTTTDKLTLASRKATCEA